MSKTEEPLSIAVSVDINIDSGGVPNKDSTTDVELVNTGRLKQILKGKLRHSNTSTERKLSKNINIVNIKNNVEKVKLLSHIGHY
jgi:hypothetical protein